MRTWPALAIMAGTCALGAAVGVAAAGSLTVAASPIEAGSVAVGAPCGTPALALAAPRSQFSAPGTYRVRQLPVSAVVTACRTLPYKVTIAGSTSPFTSLSAWGGTLPAAASGNLTDATGLDVNDVPNANTVRLYLLVGAP